MQSWSCIGTNVRSDAPDDSIESSGVFYLHKVNDRMVIHNLLPILIAVLGLISGAYIFRKSTSQRIRNDRVLTINFISLGILNIYIGSVYSLVLFGFISAVPSAELSIYMRPANLLQVVLPFLISWRMGL